MMADFIEVTVLNDKGECLMTLNTAYIISFEPNKDNCVMVISCPTKTFELKVKETYEMVQKLLDMERMMG